MKDDDIEQDDLRSPRTPWAVLPPPPIEPIADSFRCEVLIIGAGITGALVAERLTRQGRQVVIIDRDLPSLGSTVASTVMLLWEIDRPLFELAQLYGLREGGALLSGQPPCRARPAVPGCAAWNRLRDAATSFALSRRR